MQLERAVHVIHAERRPVHVGESYGGRKLRQTENDFSFARFRIVFVYDFEPKYDLFSIRRVAYLSIGTYCVFVLYTFKSF